MNNEHADYFYCSVCKKCMFDLKAGEVCYLISKQTASKKIDEISKENRTVFNRNAIGFRFCEECWFSYAGKGFEIKL